MSPSTDSPSRVEVGPELSALAVPGMPRVTPGSDLAELMAAALRRAELTLERHDVLVVTSKIVSRAENRFVDLAQVTVSERARELAEQLDKEPELVELVLRESTAVSRTAPGVLVVRHRLGFVSANAGIDSSNLAAGPTAEGRRVLLLPRDPDASARSLRDQLRRRFDVEVGVIISDSHGRPFRLGTIGSAIGVAGVPALWDQRGQHDLDGRELEHTVTALADQIASVADLVAGQADEGRPVVRVRGIRFAPRESSSAAELIRPPEQDLYA